MFELHFEDNNQKYGPVLVDSKELAYKTLFRYVKYKIIINHMESFSIFAQEKYGINNLDEYIKMNELEPINTIEHRLSIEHVKDIVDWYFDICCQKQYFIIPVL